MRFRITHFLLVILLCAGCLLPLSAPSVWWVLSLPAFLCLLAIYSASKVVQSRTEGRVFWTAFPMGVASYLAGVALVAYLCSVRERFVNRLVWDDYIGLPLWKLVHGEDAFTVNNRNILNEDFVSFLVWIHVVIAMALSSVAAFIAQVVATWRTAAVGRQRVRGES